MIPWKLLDTARIPGASGELRLCRRGEEFSIRVEGCELMNSRAHGSEDALAELACAKLAKHPGPRILIGGLGMGFTIAAALNMLGPDARIVVAELVPEVVEWNRGPLAHLACHPLQDRRVTVRTTDVAKILQEKNQTFDAILLDVDNGPSGLTRKSNDWLYSKEGVQAAFATLNPAGILAVWAAGADRSFSRRLKLAGFAVTEVHARARGPHGGGHHTIWTAARAS